MVANIQGHPREGMAHTQHQLSMQHFLFLFLNVVTHEPCFQSKYLKKSQELIFKELFLSVELNLVTFDQRRCSQSSEI